MTISDFIPAAQEKARRAVERATRREEKLTARNSTVISRAFAGAASRYERTIAESVVNHRPLEIALDGSRPVERPFDLLRCVRDTFAYATGTAHITRSEIERNEDYKEFLNEIGSQGFKVSQLEARDVIQRGGCYTLARMWTAPQK